MTKGTIPPPIENIDSEPTISICINKVWANRLIDQIWGLRYPEAWGGTLEENKHARAEIKNLINMLMEDKECGEMSGNCCLELYIIQRVNVTTGLLEISINNGVSWQPAPGSLPTMIVQPVPPVTSGVSATKCDAATNAMQHIDDWITHVGTDFDTATTLVEFAALVVLAIVNAVLLILSEGALTAAELQIIGVISAALAAVWAGGKTLFVDYWSSDNKDKILCALFCTIGSDGSFTDGQFSEFWNKASADLPGGLAKSLFLGFMSSIGSQGLSTMAATGASADADCSGCTDCLNPCDNVEFLSTNGGYTTSSDSVGTRGEWVAGQGWVQTYRDNGIHNNRLFVISPDISSCTITNVKMHFVVDSVFPSSPPYYGVGVGLQFVGGAELGTVLNIEPTGTGDYDVFFDFGSTGDTSFTITGDSYACGYRLVGIDFNLP